MEIKYYEVQDLGQDEDEDKFEEDEKNYRPGSRSSISSISKTESFKSVGKCFARGIKVLMYDGTHQNVEELNFQNFSKFADLQHHISFGVTSTTMLSYFKSVQGRFRVILSKIHGVNPIDSQISAVSWLV
ncbi:unnamed protein product [Rhizophagus irregularis]|nr:unnamed protein product [Rhizophagus irregularis]